MQIRCLMGWLAGAALTSSVVAAPVPVYQNDLDDLASATALGGQALGSAPTFPPSEYGNKFQSTGDSRLFWSTAETQAIFTGWDDTAGITMDALISGFGPGITRDSGIWSVGHRNNDNFFIAAVQNDTLRINIRNDSGVDAGNTRTVQTGNLGLVASTTYRVTIQQHASNGNGGDMLVYLESLTDGGAQYAPGTLVGTLDLAAGYNFNFPLEAGSGPALGMSIGNRHPFGSATTILKDGEAIDQVRIYNGNHHPSELAIPEPSALLLAAGGLVLLRRRRIACPG